LTSTVWQLAYLRLSVRIERWIKSRSSRRYRPTPLRLALIAFSFTCNLFANHLRGVCVVGQLYSVSLATNASPSGHRSKFFLWRPYCSSSS